MKIVTTMFLLACCNFVFAEDLLYTIRFKDTENVQFDGSIVVNVSRPPGCDIPVIVGYEKAIKLKANDPYQASSDILHQIAEAIGESENFTAMSYLPLGWGKESSPPPEPVIIKTLIGKSTTWHVILSLDTDQNYILSIIYRINTDKNEDG